MLDKSSLTILECHECFLLLNQRQADKLKVGAGDDCPRCVELKEAYHGTDEVLIGQLVSYIDKQ